VKENKPPEWAQIVRRSDLLQDIDTSRTGSRGQVNTDLIPDSHLQQISDLTGVV